MTNTPRPSDMARFQRKLREEERRRKNEAANVVNQMRAERKKAERLKKQVLAQSNLLDFTEYTMPHPDDPDDAEKSLYEAAKHHKAIAAALEELEKGTYTQLILTTPPRHGKTELATKRFTAWYMGRNPMHSMAVAAYSDTMAMDYGGDTRAIIASKEFSDVFPNFRLRRGGAAKDNIQTTLGGRIVFVGRGGALTGRGANCLIIDDPFSSYEEARSQAIRDSAWNWFTKVAMTRRMGKKLVLIIMTRWHPDDIVGRLTDPENPNYSAEEAKGWRIINLPAIAEDDDPLGRAPGEPLWPERFDLDFLKQQQRLDPLGFSALYQQRPTVADGTLFQRENIRFYDKAPPDLRIYCASDHAVSTDQRRDATVLLTVGVDREDNIYVLDCWWQRQPTDVVVEAMLNILRLRKPLLWFAEKGHISKSIGPFLKKRMQEEGVHGNIREMTPAGDKETRAQSIAARTSMGKVLFPRSAFWSEKAINEMLAFPNGTHDDFVDALAYIGLGLQSTFKASAPKPSSGPPKYGTYGWVKWLGKRQEREAALKARGGF